MNFSLVVKDISEIVLSDRIVGRDFQDLAKYFFRFSIIATDGVDLAESKMV